MKYKVGDCVKVKSLQWFNENQNDSYDVVFANGWHFSEPMSIFCGKELIIESISHATNPPHYKMKDNIFAWTDEMIECKVEDTITTNEQLFEPSNISLEKEMEWNLPKGYQFVDENGNVINATKIVLEKKNEYPKTYEECCKIMQVARPYMWFHYSEVNSISRGDEYERHMENTLCVLRRLLICRDAYWKLYGEEMGLGKPWKPDWNNISDKYCIYFVSGDAWSKECQTRQCPFAFPTEEMRDAFKENFDPDIEICKELL